jgi:hypothetical protein
MPSFDISGAIDELRAVYVAAVPDVTEVTEAEHLDLVDWLDIAVPYGVILCSEFERAEAGLANLSFEFEVDLWHVLQVSGASAGLRSVLETLIDAFWPPRATGHFQVLDVLAWGYGAEDGPNELFRSADRLQRAGYVRLLCQIAVTN